MKQLRIALSLTACVLCLAIYQQAHIAPQFLVLTGLLGLGLWVPWYRGVVMVVLGLVALLMLLFFHTRKMMGGADLFEVMPDLIAVVADTNPGEVKATLINLWSLSEVLSLLFLLACLGLFFTLRRRSPAVANQRILVGLSLPALVALVMTPGFVLHKTAAGIDESWQVYTDNARRIKDKQSFRWDAQAGYPGRDTVVLVLGETTRGDHLGINGYARNTTPRLAQVEGLISYTQAISNANYTLLSTPIIMTRSSGQTENLVFPETSLISAYKEAGYATHYVSYLDKLDEGGSFIDQMASEADHYHKSVAGPDGLEDLAGLALVRSILSQADKKKLIVFKMIGSHLNFQDRFSDDFNHFRPSYRDVIYTGPQPEQSHVLVNSYDNSVRVTDYVLAELIGQLATLPGRASLSFVSDHGTALFEDGQSSYGGFTRYNYDIGLLFWFAQGYFDAGKVNNLRRHRHARVDTTCFLDTLLSVTDIRTPRKKGCDLTRSDFIPMRKRQVAMHGGTVDYDTHFGLLPVYARSVRKP